MNISRDETLRRSGRLEENIRTQLGHLTNEELQQHITYWEERREHANDMAIRARLMQAYRQEDTTE